MRLSNAVCLIALMLASGGIALAQGSDPIVVPSRGPTGSPPCATLSSLALGNGTIQDDCTVAGGQAATSVTIVLPSADFTGGESVTCGISNAFLDSGPTQLINGILGFLPTYNPATNTDSCTWNVFTGTNPDEGTESVKQMEADCWRTNATNSLPRPLQFNDPDDCAGVPGGTSNSDIVYSITGAVTGSPADDIVAITTGVPEPSSASLLLLGLVGLGFFARRKLLA